MDLLDFVRFIRTKYLVLFGSEKYDTIYNRTRYFIRFIFSSVFICFPHNYARIKIHSKDTLYLEKTLALHNIVLLIKSVLNKGQNHYSYNIFLEKCSDKLAKK